MAETMKVEIFGLMDDISFHRARCCAEELSKSKPSIFPAPKITGMLEFEWNLYLDEKKRELRGDVWSFEDNALVFVNNRLLGGPDGFTGWAEKSYGFEEFRPTELYETLKEEAYKSHLNSKNHDYVYFVITMDGKEMGKLLIELFSDVLPKTCENFKCLCTGEKGVSSKSSYKLHYTNTLVHRIVPNGWIQAGDIYHGRGNSGESIYGQTFEDENYAISHDKRGIIGMANKGRHTNGSQFYITLQPAKWMDTKYVAFGQVIEGTETLQKIEKAETMNERPINEMRISSSGTSTYEF